ncbi:MAG: FitA-like ribbon-helix-helix domain-containing protein [Terriglobales bacterium]
MPTLYVEKVPADLYAALRARAKARRSSIAAETIAILRASVPTAAALRQRRAAGEALLRLRNQAPPRRAGQPTNEQLLRASRQELGRRGL